MVTNKKMTSSTYKTFHIGVFFVRRTYRGSTIGGEKKKRRKTKRYQEKNRMNPKATQKCSNEKYLAVCHTHNVMFYLLNICPDQLACCEGCDQVRDSKSQNQHH